MKVTKFSDADMLPVASDERSYGWNEGDEETGSQVDDFDEVVGILDNEWRHPDAEVGGVGAVLVEELPGPGIAIVQTREIMEEVERHGSYLTGPQDRMAIVVPSVLTSMQSHRVFTPPTKPYSSRWRGYRLARRKLKLAFRTRPDAESRRCRRPRTRSGRADSRCAP